MRICVIGAGSIGGLLAAKLARAGEDVDAPGRRSWTCDRGAPDPQGVGDRFRNCHGVMESE
jgi:prephenate dehydrogenase